MAGKFKINGVDVAATYAMDFEEFSDAATPGAKIRYDDGKQEFQEKRISFRFHLAPADRSTTTMQGYLEGLAELVGVHGLRNKEVLLEQLYGESTSVAYAYICILESYEVDQASPAAFVHPVVYGRMTFIVVGIVDPNGITTRTATLTGLASLKRNYYFEDANCAQGSAAPIITAKVSTGSAIFSVETMAVDSQLSYIRGFIRNGGVPIVDGLFGRPAVNIQDTAAFLLYQGASSLSGVNQITVVVRFKTNYSVGDTSDKYLFQDTGCPLSIYIDGPSQNIVFAHPAGTTSISGASLSSSLWNTVIARIDPTIPGGAGLWLFVNGVEILSNGATITSQVGLAAGSIVIGNSTVTGNPAKCIIGEVAVYKHPITYANIGALAALTRPIADASQFDFNKNLVLLLDFTNGFTGRANKSGYVSLANAFTSSEMVVFDMGRHSAKKYSIAGGTYSDVSNEITLSNTLLDTLCLARFNKLAFGVGSSGTATYSVAYEAWRRR